MSVEHFMELDEDKLLSALKSYEPILAKKPNDERYLKLQEHALFAAKKRGLLPKK